MITLQPARLAVLALALVACGEPLPFDPSGTYAGTVELGGEAFADHLVHVEADGGRLTFAWPSQPCAFAFELEAVDAESLTYAHAPTRCEWIGGGASQALETVDGLVVVTRDELDATAVYDLIGATPQAGRRSSSTVFAGRRVTP